MRSLAPLTGEQFVVALELVTDRGERGDLARSRLLLRGADRVLAQFGKALRARFLRRASSPAEPLRSRVAGKLGDIEFEGGVADEVRSSRNRISSRPSPNSAMAASYA